MIKISILIGFIIMVLAQLYVPASMIMSSERVLKNGTEFKFKTAPVDPYDPFRGKFVQLTFDAISFQAQKEDTLYAGQRVFVSLIHNANGFAEISNVSLNPPDGTQDYVNATIGYSLEDSLNTVSITYPFDRFYMEESKAYDAELAYNEASRDTNQTTYALVVVKSGEAVVKDVIINGIPIREAALQHRDNVE